MKDYFNDSVAFAQDFLAANPGTQMVVTPRVILDRAGNVTPRPLKEDDEAEQVQQQGEK